MIRPLVLNMKTHGSSCISSYKTKDKHCVRVCARVCACVRVRVCVCVCASLQKHSEVWIIHLVHTKESLKSLNFYQTQTCFNIVFFSLITHKDSNSPVVVHSHTSHIKHTHTRTHTHTHTHTAEYLGALLFLIGQFAEGVFQLIGQ